MKNVAIAVRRQDSEHRYSFSLPFDIKVLDFRLNAQTLVGFDDEDCRLILERTGEELSDSLSVKESDIQAGDVLLVIPPLEYRLPQAPNRAVSSQSSYRKVEAYTSKDILSTVTYKLILTVHDSENSNWEYSVALLSHHENNPFRFFEELSSREYQKLEEFLEAALDRQPSTFELNKIMKAWCEDIQLGYRETFAELQR